MISGEIIKYLNKLLLAIPKILRANSIRQDSLTTPKPSSFSRKNGNWTYIIIVRRMISGDFLDSERGWILSSGTAGRRTTSRQNLPLPLPRCISILAKPSASYSWRRPVAVRWRPKINQRTRINCLFVKWITRFHFRSQCQP